MVRELRINNFDLLRILAACQVVLKHSTWHLNVATPAWWWLIDAFPGVPVFFAISGFLISASYERSSSLKNYAGNRVLRIFPALWCCVFVTIVTAMLFGFSFWIRGAAPWLVCQLVGVIYTPHFLKSFGFGSYNGSLWTIPIELQFYALLPLLYWLIRKKRNRSAYIFAIGIGFVAIAVATAVFFSPLSEPGNEPILQKLLRYSFLPHFYLFLTGVLLQHSGAYKSRWITGKGLYWLVGYLLIAYFLPRSGPAHVGLLLVLAVVAISAAYTAPTVSRTVLRGNDISYGVYIYHGLLINIFVAWGLTGRAVYVVMIAIFTGAAAYLSWIGVERPFLRKKKQTIAPGYVAAH